MKRTSKFRKLAAAAVLAAAIFGADAFAQCPSGNCQRAGYYQTSAYGAYFAPWGGWYWPGVYFYGSQPKTQQTPDAEPETAPETEPELDEIPEWTPAEPADPEPAEPAEPAEDDAAPSITPPVCPLAAMTAELINRARAERGLPALTVDPELSAACERHSAWMKARGFQHAADGGRECIAENYASPAATVNAWLGSSGHAAILLGSGTRLGIGVVGRYYTIRVR